MPGTAELSSSNAHAQLAWETGECKGEEGTNLRLLCCSTDTRVTNNANCEASSEAGDTDTEASSQVNKATVAIVRETRTARVARQGERLTNYPP